jgi:two-component system sensor histidine kinase DesK
MTKQGLGIGPNLKGRMRFSLIWLIYLVIPINALLKKPAHEMWVGFCVLAVFVVVYIVSYMDQARRLLYLLILLAIIAFFCFRYDQGFMFMGFYTAAICGMMPTKKQFWAAMIAMLALFVLVLFFSGLDLNEANLINSLPSIFVMIMMPIIMRGVFRSRELRSKLLTANEEISRLIKNEERQRISRDLHDTLGHTLSLITLKSELAEKLIGKNSERAIQEVKDIQTTARAALKQVRELVSGMNAVTIREELGHAERILSAANIELKVQGDTAIMEDSPLIQNILGMCLRESVTNVVKHSKAKHCIVECASEPGRITMTISDDGIGADHFIAGDASACAGLKGIRDRLELVEGKLHFQSAPGAGTQVIMMVPKIKKNQKLKGLCT